MLLAVSTPWMTSRTRIFFEIPVFEDCAFLLPGAIPCAVRRQSASETDLQTSVKALIWVEKRRRFKSRKGGEKRGS